MKYENPVITRGLVMVNWHDGFAQNLPNGKFDFFYKKEHVVLNHFNEKDCQL
jgi:hypothetical protein